jgi:hypothetical protein
MDTAYLVWLLLIGGGVVLSLFVKPKHVIIVGAVLMACSIAGLVVSYSLDRDKLGTLFGVATMAIPVVFAMLAIGSAIGNALKTWTKGRKSEGG